MFCAPLTVPDFRLGPKYKRICEVLGRTVNCNMRITRSRNPSKESTVPASYRRINSLAVAIYGAGSELDRQWVARLQHSCESQ
jgi:hypothetical protein